MSGPQLLETLQAKFGAAIRGANFEALDPWIDVQPAGLLEVCRYLRDDPALAMEMLNSICVVDFFYADPKQAAKAGIEPHLEVVYHLSSISLKHTLVLKVKTPRWKDQAQQELPEVPSVASVWRTADWHEREAYDLSGVCFTGHPDLRRILCPEDWVGYPLRKDYQMPLEYHGIRGR